jgi:hypothetical protein
MARHLASFFPSHPIAAACIAQGWASRFDWAFSILEFVNQSPTHKLAHAEFKPRT